MTADAQRHTKVGPGLFTWQPFLNLRRDLPAGPDAAHLWLVLYASSPAKSLPPGLWNGGIGSFMDHGRFTPGEAQKAIDCLVAHELVEFDPHHCITRFTKLPDKCERATTGNTLRGWWNRSWGSLTRCGVLERHLDLMAWLHLPFKSSKRGPNVDLQQAWDETFGSVLNTSPAPLPLSTDRLRFQQSRPQKQLELLGRPPLHAQIPDQISDSPEEVLELVLEKERGEVQERGLPVREPRRLGTGTVPPADGPDVTDLWDAAVAELARDLEPNTVTMWLEPLTASWDGDTLRVNAPHEYHRTQVRDRFGQKLAASLRTIAGREIRIAI